MNHITFHQIFIKNAFNMYLLLVACDCHSAPQFSCVQLFIFKLGRWVGPPETVPKLLRSSRQKSHSSQAHTSEKERLKKLSFQFNCCNGLTRLCMHLPLLSISSMPEVKTCNLLTEREVRTESAVGKRKSSRACLFAKTE